MNATLPDTSATLHVRLERQLNALLTISRRWRFYEADSATAFKNITESAAQALNVGRVSIWLMNADRSAIVCRDLYEFDHHRHTRGFKLTRAEFPDYFNALESDEVVAATDAYEDPATRGFAQHYLRPNNIGAMLDVPIRVGGSLTGVLCHEHIGGPRLFLSDEQTTARLLGNLASLACEIEARRDSERHSAELQSLFQAAIECADLGVVASKGAGQVTYSNARVEEVWRVPDEFFGPQTPTEDRVAFTAKLVKAPKDYEQRIRTLVSDPTAIVTNFRVELLDGKRLEISSRPQRVDGNIIGRVWTVRELTGG